MKVLHILDELNYSGAEVMLKNSAHLFIGQNIEQHALSTGKVVGVYSDKLVKSGFKIHHIPFQKTLIFFVEIYKLIMSEKYDVIHIHPERAFFWYGFVAKLAGIKKIIRTIHSLYMFNGYLKLKRKLQRSISINFFGVKFISVSSSVQKIEKENFNNTTIVIKNWIDDLCFIPPVNPNEKLNARNNFGISAEHIVIISVGNCSIIKNHFDILRALAELVKWETNVLYLHVGEGETLTEEIELVKKFGISKFVKFLGKVDNIREVLICSDIFVMTSILEGIGIVAIEAGSCGLPLLVYDSPGLKETVVDGYNGFLVKQSYEYLLDNLKKLISNENLRITLGYNARQYVLSNYNMEDSVNKLIHIYFN